MFTKQFFKMSLFHSWISWVKSIRFVIHTNAPMQVATIPATGKKGISGQATTIASPTTPVKIITITPIINKNNLVTKPTHLDTKRSVKAWNLVSREEPFAAVSAEICR